MHPNSFNLMERVVRKYHPQVIGKRVLDVGGANVNGSYRPIFNGAEYISLDRENADINVAGYNWPQLEPFDIVISGQTLEHDPKFWLTVKNMGTAAKPGGMIVIIVPSQGNVHRHPVDCYRFLPDAMQVFAEIMHTDLAKTIWDQKGHWGDLVGVYFK